MFLHPSQVARVFSLQRHFTPGRSVNTMSGRAGDWRLPPVGLADRERIDRIRRAKAKHTAWALGEEHGFWFRNEWPWLVPDIIRAHIRLGDIYKSSKELRKLYLSAFYNALRGTRERYNVQRPRYVWNPPNSVLEIDDEPVFRIFGPTSRVSVNGVIRRASNVRWVKIGGRWIPDN